MKPICLLLLAVGSYSCSLVQKDSDLTSFYGNALLLYSLTSVNYCPEAQLVLEKGKSYPISLNSGEPYWFGFSSNGNTLVSGEQRDFFFVVNKDTSTDLLYIDFRQ